MKVIFYFRNNRAGYSIGKVFDTIISQYSEKERVEVPCYNCSPLSMLKNTWCVFKKRKKEKINHITGDIHYVMPAFIGCKSVLTIHDTSSFDCCTSRLKRTLIKYLWFKVPIRLATKVVCISKETRRNVMRFTKRGDIDVIYNPVDPSFVTYLKYPDFSHLKFLIIGTAWNKNIENTLRALDGIEGEVTIVGQLNEKQQSVVNDLTTIKVINKIGLNDIDVVEEYKRCDVVLFCTIFEGFGMPIIEGQKTGRVIITSNIEPHKEIAGEGALYVNPDSVESIHDAVVKVMNQDGLYDNLVRKGLENVKRFEVSVIANEYLKLYDTL